jgi:hypothetical protein
VESVFRKFHAEAMERALVHARDESLDRLVREEFKPPEALLQFRCGVDGHENENVPTKIGRDVSMRLSVAQCPYRRASSFS